MLILLMSAPCYGYLDDYRGPDVPGGFASWAAMRDDVAERLRATCETHGIACQVDVS